MSNMIKALIAAVILAGVFIGVILVLDGENEEPRRDVSMEEVDRGVQPEEPEPEARRVPIALPDVKTLTLKGSVKDSDGSPVAGVNILARLLPGAASAQTPRQVAHATSDGKGGFELKGLAPGEYRFLARKAGYQEARLDRTLIDGQKPEPLAFVLSSGLTISGHVRDNKNDPVSNARVSALIERVSDDAPMDERFQVLIELNEMLAEEEILTRTDADGWYQISGLQDSGYRVTASAPGFANQERRHVAAGSTEVDFSLQIGGLLSGIVQDVSGRAVANATVEVFRQTKTEDLITIVTERAFPPLTSTLTDSSGRYSFDELGGGNQYRMTVLADGYQPHQELDVVITNGQETNMTLTLQMGQILKGVVYDPAGAALQGARVKVNLTGVQPAGPPISLRDDGLLTDEQGFFVFDTLKEGEYRVVVSHPDYASLQQSGIRPGDAELSLQLGQGGAISGVVFDSITSQPVPGAKVVVRDLAGVEKTGVSGNDGRYFVRGITEQRNGEAIVNVEAKGYKRIGNEKIPVTEGSTTEGTDFALERNGRVAGTVLGADGAPVAGVNVVVKRRHSARVPVIVSDGPPAVTDRQGRFVLDDVSPGDQNFVEGTHPLFLTSPSEEFDLLPGQEVTGLTLGLRVGGSITGIVIDDNGVPVADAIIAIKDARLGESSIESFPTRTESDGEGRFRLTSLPEGEHALVAQKRGYLRTEVTGIVVEEGFATDGQQIVLELGSYLYGKVTDARGAPVRGATVTVIDTSDGLRKEHRTTNSDGDYAFDNLRKYPVTVEASAAGYGKKSLYDVPTNSEHCDFQLEKLGTILGYVYDQNGVPVPTFSVKVTGDHNNQVRRPRTFQTPDGQFLLEGIAPGVYQVTIGAPGYNPEIIDGVQVVSDQVTQMPSVTLREGGKIAGYVVDDVSGEPIASAFVQIMGGEGTFVPKIGDPGRRSSRARTGSRVRTDQDGYFLIEGLAREKVSLRVEHRDYMSLNQNFVESGDMAVTLRLTRGGAVEGLVTGSDGRGISGLTLLISGGKSDRQVTDRKGYYRFQGLPDGQYTVRVSPFGRKGGDGTVPQAEAYDVVITGGQAVNLNIRHDSN